MLYSLKKPIMVTVDNIGDTFQITSDDFQDILYNGKATVTKDIDIAPIIRQIVRPTNYKFTDTQQSVAIFELNYITGDRVAQLFEVLWDYKDDMQRQTYFDLANYGIQDYVYNGQWFPLVIYNDSDTHTRVQLIEVDEQGDGGINYTWNVPSRSSYYINSKLSIVDEGTSVFYRSNIGLELSHRYKCITCVPPNIVTLYYINKAGGLSWVHCDRKNIKETNITRNQIEHRTTNSTQFGIDNYHIQTYNSYTLNTNYLNDKQSELIQELFISPRVWMFTYNDSMIKSVVLTDTKTTVKNFNNNKMFNYTINCKDSIVENIYA